MPDVTLSETCLCGGENWHTLVDGVVVWCKRCGCMRPARSRYWRVPHDRATELSWCVIVEGGDDEEEEAPTQPGKEKRL